MPDVTVAAVTTATDARDAVWGPYWTSSSVGYVVTITAVSQDVDVYKTTDSGASWVAQDTLNNFPGADNRSLAVWYDKETPGNIGTLIHIAVVKSTAEAAHYAAFDTADDTYGTIRTVDIITMSSTSGDTDIGITVAKSGRLYICVRGDFELDVEDTDHSMRSSSDLFASDNQSETSPYSSDEEQLRLYPGTDADQDDISAVVFDGVNTDLEFWKYDRSGTSWGVTTIDASILVTSAEARDQKGFFDAKLRLSDEHILVAYWNDRDTATADLRTVDITQDTPTITQEGDLHQSDDSFCAGMLINQQNDDVYVGYGGSDAGDETLDATVVCYFKLSTNGMTDWGSEQTYGIESVNIRKVSGGFVGDDGGRVMSVWYRETSTTAIKVNDGNDIEIEAAAPAPASGVPVEVPAAHGAVILVAPGRMIAG